MRTDLSDKMGGKDRTQVERQSRKHEDGRQEALVSESWMTGQK